MLSLINGLTVDGPGNVLVDGNRIVDVGAAAPPLDCEEIDCSGLLLAPGFIDLHSHSDVQVLERRMEKVKQGVTTEVVGNCGFSPFPYTDNPGQLREFGGGILGRNQTWGWRTAAEYLTAVENSDSPVHVASLVGHGSLRVAVAGLGQAPLSYTEMDRMAGLLEDALDAGCAGFSTGLMYAPGSSAGRDELLPLCRIAARRDKLYATHMRSYSAGLLEAVREQLDLTRGAGCRLQISHLQAAGRGNWDLQQAAIDEIESARRDGVDVEFDIYPYQCGSTVLTQWLPAWALDGGNDRLMERLADPETRARILAGMEQSRSQSWADITVSGVASDENADLAGRTIEEIADARGRDGGETALDLLLEERGAVNVISFNQSESNLRQLLTHPLCSVISDGFYVNGRPHPRLHGTFPELLGSVVRDRRWLTLQEALHKITAQPAARLGLTDRGALKPGYKADITIFDPARIASPATYDRPQADPVGIAGVIEDGRMVFRGEL